ncbi:transmembrane adaptor Erv26-domain-containing protein [Lactarius quietus]|nr:transmembrane adaptor Erv26-domain-containing protein [Lactarius quietus]
MTFLHLLSYVAAVAAFLFVTLSLASGLLWLSELIEEHSKLAKALGKKGIYVRVSVVTSPPGINIKNRRSSVAQDRVLHTLPRRLSAELLTYMARHFPYLASFVASCILVVADHFMWFFHFARRAHEAREAAHKAYRGGPVVRPPTFGDMATFFGLCVWLTPLFLFLSLSANDNTLPTAENQGSPSAVNSPSAASFPTPGQRPRPARSSLLRLMFGFVPGLRRASSRSAEGLIAPPSPGIPPLSPPSHTHSFHPRTPTRTTSHGEALEPMSAGLQFEFSLNRPPPRRTTSTGLSPAVRRRGPGM